jgi:hypothetical protein
VSAVVSLALSSHKKILEYPNEQHRAELVTSALFVTTTTDINLKFKDYNHDDPGTHRSEEAGA